MLAQTAMKPSANVRALNYQNKSIVERLATEGGMSFEEAETLFRDTLKFLSLTGSGVKLSPTEKIDLGWHNFILHTKEYTNFCEDCFGQFIHHEPGSGLNPSGPRLDVHQTRDLAASIFGNLSQNWEPGRGETCGSNGC